MRAWKRFFVDLRLPYSVARNEQVEIKAVIHNYGYEDMHVSQILQHTSCCAKQRHIHTIGWRKRGGFNKDANVKIYKNNCILLFSQQGLPTFF